MEKVNPHEKYSGLTMTVKELRSALSEYQDDLPVIAEWEGVAAGIRPENIKRETHNGREELAIDVEQYG